MSTRKLIDSDEKSVRDAEYRDEIARLASCLASGAVDELRDAVEGPVGLERLISFVDGNFTKRMDWLKGAVEFIAPAFQNLDALLEEYVNEEHLVAVGANMDDADAFLAWLQITQNLSPMQQDYVACERARCAAEAQALANRLGHLRFQELASLAVGFAESLVADPKAAETLLIQVNPIRVWTRMLTAELLGSSSDLPADVLFFAAGGGVNTAEFSSEARDLVLDLCECAPCTLESWACVNLSIDPEQLAGMCLQLAQLGLIAFS